MMDADKTPVTLNTDTTRGWRTRVLEVSGRLRDATAAAASTVREVSEKGAELASREAKVAQLRGKKSVLLRGRNRSYTKIGEELILNREALGNAIFEEISPAAARAAAEVDASDAQIRQIESRIEALKDAQSPSPNTPEPHIEA